METVIVKSKNDLNRGFWFHI